MGQILSNGVRSVGSALGASTYISKSKENAVHALGGHRFYLLNDVVMGGRSLSSLQSLPGDGLLFSGTIDTNGGGFASFRSDPEEKPISIPQGASCMVLRVTGDGKQYKVTLSNGKGGGPFATSPVYAHDLWTKAGQEQELSFPLSDFKASFGGRLGKDQTPLVPSDVVQAGVMLSLYDASCEANPTFKEAEATFGFKLEVKSLGFA